MLDDMILRLKELSDYFRDKGIFDIFTNSKIYEMVIAEQMNHRIINGHAYTSDARDEEGHLFEYKHFKLSSSNHTWTFNDFSEGTINNLGKIDKVVFAIINDVHVIPEVQDIYIVPAVDVSKYLLQATPSIQNTRPMINISTKQIKENMVYEHIQKNNTELSAQLQKVFYTINQMERECNITGLLTSNKLWELLVADKLGHHINPEQKKHDAVDENGNTYEYKVSKLPGWIFQDISDNVLDSYLNDRQIVLAVVDKVQFRVRFVYLCEPQPLVKLLRKKRDENYTGGRMVVYVGARDIRNLREAGNAICLR